MHRSLPNFLHESVIFSVIANEITGLDLSARMSQLYFHPGLPTKAIRRLAKHRPRQNLYLELQIVK